MRLNELLRISMKGVLANPKRSFLSALGIIIGIASVITILSLGAGIKQDTLKNLNADSDGKQTTEIYYNAGATNGSPDGFTERDVSLIESKYPNVDAKIGHGDRDLEVFATINDVEQNVLTHLSQTATENELIFGHNLSANSIKIGQSTALISKQLATKMFNHPQNALGSSLTVGTTNYTIVGVMKNSKFGLILPQKVFTQNQNPSEGDRIKLTFSAGTDINRESKKIANLLEHSGSHHLEGVYEYTDLGEMLKDIGKIIGGLTYFITAVAAISLLIAGIGVMNMMYISVAERTQEIGIRMSLGASPKNITTQFLFEALFVTCFGGFLGFVIGIGLAKFISNFLPFNAIVTAKALILALGVSTLVGLVFGILPAKSAARKNLIDILR